LGRRSELRDLVEAGPDGKGIRVKRGDKIRILQGVLKSSDRIDGLVVGGAGQPLRTPLEVHNPGLRLPPRTPVALQNNGGARVRLQLGQGVDTQNPLLTLFATRPGQGGERHWIGWSPLGPYDCSGRAAERFLGWHFNTGEAQTPARFALADQYRNDFYR